MMASANLIPMAAVALVQLAPAFETMSANMPASIIERQIEALHFGNSFERGRSVADHLAYIGSLSAGWDGYASSPISREIIDRVSSAIDYFKSLAPIDRDPGIVPCADGSLQLEWHLPDSEFEMYFETNGSVSAWWHDVASGAESEREGTLAIELLAHWAVRDAAWAIAA